MLFKPNFCCNCGEKVERAEWGILTSRRFCPACAADCGKYDWLPRVVVLAGILMGIFGLGSLSGSRGPQQPTVQNDQTPKLAVGAKQQAGIKDEERIVSPVPDNRGTTAVPPDMSSADSTKKQPDFSGTASDASVYFCGALTKKGKPCSRRVKTKGRCWQHMGQPSALVSQSTPDVY